MPSYKFNKPYYNVASEGNELTLEEAYNVHFESLPTGGFAIRRRPGLTSIDTNTFLSARGLYWSDSTKLLYVAADNKVYRYVFPTTVKEELGDLSSGTMPVVFAEGQNVGGDTILYMSRGSLLNYINHTTGTLETPTDVDTPSSSFIAMMNNRFYANDINHPQDFRITDYNPDPAVQVLDPLYWSSSANPFRASQKPDPIVGIYTGWNEVYIWGTTACEVWQEDGVTPVSPLVGSIIEAGLAAPYSVQIANNAMFALANLSGKRAVVMINGRSPQVLSEAIARQLQDLPYVKDAIGSLCFVGGLNLYILSFPIANITWAYDFKTDTWSQWSTWNLTDGLHGQFEGVWGTYAKDWNKHVVLSKSGDLSEITRDSFTDNGTPIRSSVRTGWLDQGTWDRKRCNQLIIKLRGYNPSAATILMRWRDDGFPEWSKPIELALQSNSQNDHYAKLNRMGMYRSRQYEFIMTDAADMALIGMEEDVTKMRN